MSKTIGVSIVSFLHNDLLGFKVMMLKLLINSLVVQKLY